MIRFFIMLWSFNTDAAEMKELRKHAAALVRRSTYALKRTESSNETIEKTTKKCKTDVIMLNDTLRAMMEENRNKVG